MASSSGGKRIFHPQKWVPLRAQDIKPENMAQPRGKLPPLDPAVAPKTDTIEPMSILSQDASPPPRSVLSSHPATFLELDSTRAEQSQFRSQFIPPRPEVHESAPPAHDFRIAPLGYPDDSKSPRPRYRKNSMTGLSSQPEQPTRERIMHVGSREELPATAAVGGAQDALVNSPEGIPAGSHVSLAPSVSAGSSASQISLPNSAQYVVSEAAAETAIVIDHPSEVSTSNPGGAADIPAGNPESRPPASRFSRDTISSSSKKTSVVHQKGFGKGGIAEAPFREGEHRDFTQENMDAAEQDMHRKMVSDTVTRAKERVELIEKDSYPRAPTFGRWSCFQRWAYKRRLKKAAQGTKRWKVHWSPWLESLKAIEGAFGSAVMLTFAFLRWVLFLNVMIAAIWIGMLIIPFWVKPPPGYSWKLFTKPGFKAVVQGDALERTWVYFGGYFYSRADQPGAYRVDWAYPTAIALMFLVSLIALLVSIASRITGSGDASMPYKSSVFPFSALVFTSWDYHVTSHDAATKLRRSIRTELQELIADISSKAVTTGVTWRDRLGYFAAFVLWPLSLGASVVAIVFLVKYAGKINTKIGTGFGQPLLLAALNVVGPMITRLIVAMENWKPAVHDRVLLVKLYLLRAINLSTLITRLFMMLNGARREREGEREYADCSVSKSSCGDGYVCCTNVNLGTWGVCTVDQYLRCVPTCVENTVGVQLIRLIITTTLINNGLELLTGFVTLWVFKSKRQMSVENMALDILYLEALIWIGSCFAPATAPLAVIVNLVTFYCMKLSLTKTCSALEKRYSASRTSNVSYGLLCLTLILCSVPVSLLLVQSTTSFCGPVRNERTMYSVLSTYIQKAPSIVWIVLEWIGNPGILIGILAILAVSLVLLRSQLARSRQHLKMTTRELDLQKREVVERSSFMRTQRMSQAFGARLGGSSMSLPRS